MKLMPMGDYYVWHCDWCDSTNYTVWTRLERDGLACAACHQRLAGLAPEPANLASGLNRIAAQTLTL